MMSENEIQVADLRHRAVDANMKNVAPQSLRETTMDVRDHSRSNFVLAPGDFSDYRVDAIGRSA